MIDIELIRNDPTRLRAALDKRGATGYDFDAILALDQQRRRLIVDIDQRRKERNDLAQDVGRLRKEGVDTTERQAGAAKLKSEIASLEAALSEVEATLTGRVAELPNLPDPRVPPGDKENNRVVKTWGQRPELPTTSLDHVELCTRLGLVDYERGTKLGGSGFWIYTGRGAALEWALLDFFCREHFAAGYTFMLPPHMLLDQCGFAAGQFPKFWDDVFHVQTREEERSRFLLPTAETAILSVYGNETLDPAKLPIKAFAYTPCYRREAGTYRADERGTVRGHQFNKVEMFQFVAPEDSDRAFQELVGRAEGLVEKLGLHYQTSLLAAGDMSASMAMTCDIEVWLPSMGKYKEVSSVSWAHDYQARRANIRYRQDGKKGASFIHTLNGSGLATSRLIPAIVEQNQRPDGSVVVPEPLRPWLGTDVLRPI